MSARTPTELVDTREAWTAEDWWRLELRAFGGAPRVLHALAILAPPRARQDEYTQISVRAVLQSIAYMYMLVGPLLAAALMIRWAWTGAYGDEFPLAAVGVLLVVAMLVTVYSEIQERRHPRAATWQATLTLTLMRIVPGAVVLAIALTAGRELLRDGAWWALLVVIADIAVHVVILLRGPTRPGGPQTAVDNVDVSVAELDPAQRDMIAASLRDAVERLAERGLIDSATRATAERASLGHLGLTMHPPPALASAADSR